MESDGQSVPTRQDDRKFESLLDEVLTTLEAEKPEIDASDETLKANEKLVHVIISAGVDSLHASPRIRTGDQRYARAVKSLKAVTVILSKNTQLLYKAHVALPGTTILPPEVNEASVNPFTRFLIAKLVSLISLDLPSEVIEPIAPLLETIYIIIDRGFVESPEVALDSIVTYLLGTV